MLWIAHHLTRMPFITLTIFKELEENRINLKVRTKNIYRKNTSEFIV